MLGANITSILDSVFVEHHDSLSWLRCCYTTNFFFVKGTNWKFKKNEMLLSKPRSY